jgi:hypothetical protein
MSRIRGFFPLCAVLSILFTFAGAREASAAGAPFQIQVVITDTTTSTTTVFVPQVDGGPNDTNPSPTVIQVGGGFNTSATGVSLTGLNATTVLGASSTQLSIGGTASIVAGSSDHYVVTITTSHSSYLTPPGSTATLSESQSGTYTATAGASQTFQAYYQNPGTLGVAAGITPGPQTIAIPTAPTGSGSSPPQSVGINPYATGYTLTNVITLNINGNGTNSNANIGFSGTEILSAASVPEPASIVMMLTGMPVPIMLLGMLRRRRKASANS